ncbi:ATP-grasp domain-containing protein [Paramaledivibacter caminithermalis]|jgi:biotin carboxylase|uniref:ATP-grasp domain-containing protein n=1 Tax=Paramaledivibacter caminithermalis (strain DSM 15212 / CIP 107654 / DViRD3) TaxID=1121301 RepID=A0A1M6T4V7_PARC5|nr:ATP-grasp domain-containing protein [Paramaledivibacter caminithermalis]SHK51936.1 ATP-grasp domain-containing protein [Paramaledivibacter caminithermalis DSM 15212]
MYSICLGRREEVLKALKSNNIGVIAIVDRRYPRPSSKFYNYFHHVDDISDFEIVRAVCEPYIKNLNICSVIAPGESSILTAGQLRDTYGIQGRGYKISLSLRNKFEMYKVARKNNIPVADTLFVSLLEDAEMFIRTKLKQGKTCIAKPVSGFGTSNVMKITSINDWYQYKYLYLTDKTFFMRDGVILQEFVEGAEYHIDAVIQNSKIQFISISRYLKNNLGFNSHKMVGSVMLLESDLEYSVLKKFNEDVVQAFGICHGVIHHECFLNELGNPILGEVAIRPGGNYIPEMIENATNINLYDIFVKVENQIPVAIHHQKLNESHGYVHIPIHRTGNVKKLVPSDDLLKLEGIIDVRYEISEGQDVSEARYSFQRAGVILGKAKSSTELQKILKKACLLSYPIIESEE